MYLQIFLTMLHWEKTKLPLQIDNLIKYPTWMPHLLPLQWVGEAVQIRTAPVMVRRENDRLGRRTVSTLGLSVLQPLYTFAGKLYQNGRNPTRPGVVLRGGTVVRAREGVYQRGLLEKTLSEGVSATDVLFGEWMIGHPKKKFWYNLERFIYNLTSQFRQLENFRPRYYVEQF